MLHTGPNDDPEKKYITTPQPIIASPGGKFVTSPRSGNVKFVTGVAPLPEENIKRKNKSCCSIT